MQLTEQNPSREAAKERNARRKPWVPLRNDDTSPEGAKEKDSNKTSTAHFNPL